MRAALPIRRDSTRCMQWAQEKKLVDNWCMILQRFASWLVRGMAESKFQSHETR